MENKSNKEKKNTFMIPSEEEKNNILKQFNQYLISLNISNIPETSKFFCLQYNLFKDYFFQEFLNQIYQNLEKEKKIEYLYLMIEIIKTLNDNKSNNKISQDELNNLFFGIKEICKSYYYCINNDFIKAVKDALIKLKEFKIYNEEDINTLLMEIRITTDPKLAGTENDRNCLSNLYKEQLLKIDKNMIDLYKDIESVKRGNYNVIRMNLIKKENELIEKQMDLYNKNLEQIKNINEIIALIDKKYPGIK